MELGIRSLGSGLTFGHDLYFATTACKVKLVPVPDKGR
jgi:hypothetical protein